MEIVSTVVAAAVSTNLPQVININHHHQTINHRTLAVVINISHLHLNIQVQASTHLAAVIRNVLVRMTANTAVLRSTSKYLLSLNSKVSMVFLLLFFLADKL